MTHADLRFNCFPVPDLGLEAVYGPECPTIVFPSGPRDHLDGSSSEAYKQLAASNTPRRSLNPKP